MESVLLPILVACVAIFVFGLFFFVLYTLSSITETNQKIKELQHVLGLKWNNSTETYEKTE